MRESVPEAQRLDTGWQGRCGYADHDELFERKEGRYVAFHQQGKFKLQQLLQQQLFELSSSGSVASASNKTGVEKLVALAESKLGSKYVRGAKGRTPSTAPVSYIGASKIRVSARVT
jgi:hypothetical protein